MFGWRHVPLRDRHNSVRSSPDILPDINKRKTHFWVIGDQWVKWLVSLRVSDKQTRCQQLIFKSPNLFGNPSVRFARSLNVQPDEVTHTKELSSTHRSVWTASSKAPRALLINQLETFGFVLSCDERDDLMGRFKGFIWIYRCASNSWPSCRKSFTQ